MEIVRRNETYNFEVPFFPSEVILVLKQLIQHLDLQIQIWNLYRLLLPI